MPEKKRGKERERERADSTKELNNSSMNPSDGRDFLLPVPTADTALHPTSTLTSSAIHDRDHYSLLFPHCRSIVSSLTPALFSWFAGRS